VFSFAANDGSTDSNLGFARVAVRSGASCGLGAELALVLMAIRTWRRRFRRAPIS